MKKFRYFYVITLLILLQSTFNSCINKSSTLSVKKEDLPVFDTITITFPSNVSNSISGCFKNEQNSSHFFFSDVNTKKCIYLIDENYKHYQTIPLDFIKKLEYRISDIEVINKDSILVLTDYLTNKLLLINSGGEIRKQLNLKDIKDQFGNQFEFTSSPCARFAQNEFVIFKLSPDQEFIDSKFANESDNQRVKKYYQTLNKIPRFIKIRNPFGKIQIDFIEQPEIIRKKADSVFRPSIDYFHIAENKIIESNMYEGGIFIFNLDELKSSFHKINIKNFDFKQTTFSIDKFVNIREKSLGEIDSIFKTSAKIERIFYINNKYHFIASKRRSLEDVKNLRKMDYLWITQNNQKEFNSISEFNSDELIPNFSFYSDKYIYLLINSTQNQHYDPLQKKFIRIKT